MNYVAEMDDPGTIRRYEWSGIFTVVRDLATIDTTTRWLDYGCGTGGLVRFAQAHGVPSTRGFEQGWSAEQLRNRGIDHLRPEDLPNAQGSFDIVTAIEVIEHVVDPIAELTQIRALLRQGGLLFLTTGNARPHRNRLLRWRYVLPDVHISFFEPHTLALALTRSGFTPSFPVYTSAWEDIIRFKVLKSLSLRSLPRIDQILPWAPLSRIVDSRLGVSAHPVGWAS